MLFLFEPNTHNGSQCYYVTTSKYVSKLKLIAFANHYSFCSMLYLNTLT